MYRIRLVYTITKSFNALNKLTSDIADVIKREQNTSIDAEFFEGVECFGVSNPHIEVTISSNNESLAYITFDDFLDHVGIPSIILKMSDYSKVDESLSKHGKKTIKKFGGSGIGREIGDLR